jgi:hypothetical protein
VTSFPSMSVLSVSMPVTSVSMPTSKFVSVGGPILASNNGGGFPFASGTPISSSRIQNVRFHFGWNVHSGTLATPSHDVGNNVSKGFNIP